LAACTLSVAAACSGTPTAPSSVPSSTLGGGGTTQSATQSTSADAVASPQGLTSGTVAGAVGATRFVAFGDSITRGVLSSFDGTVLFDAGPSVSYPYQLLTGLINNHPSQAFSVENQGVPGETAATGSQRLQSVLDTYHPQVLLLLEGVNDLNGGFGVNATISRLQTMLEIARLYNVTVLIGNMYQTYVTEDPIDGHIRSNGASEIPSLNAGIQQIAQGQQNVFVVDLFHAFGSDRSLVGGDGLHPTEAGYTRIAAWYRGTIEEKFAVRGAFQ
jgi:lysophospholipase L1-like esterase